MNKTKSTHATYGIIYEDTKRNRFFIHSLVENSMIPIDIVHLLPTNKRYKPERGQNPYLIAIAWSFINRLGWYDRIRRIIDRIFFPKNIQLVSTIKSSFNKYTCNADFSISSGPYQKYPDCDVPQQVETNPLNS